MCFLLAPVKLALALAWFYLMGVVVFYPAPLAALLNAMKGAF